MTHVKMTVPAIRERKNGAKLKVVTAYDTPTARIADRAGTDIILVGDTLAHVVLGYEDTLPATTRVASAPSARDANNVADYNNFSMTPIADITGSTIAGLAGYTASVKIAQAGATFSLPATDVLQIDVRVQSGATDLTLTGYRFRYAPRAVP